MGGIAANADYDPLHITDTGSTHVPRGIFFSRATSHLAYVRVWDGGLVGRKFCCVNVLLRYTYSHNHCRDLRMSVRFHVHSIYHAGS